jgi:hypothetical protein
MIELHGVYTSESAVARGSKTVRDWAKSEEFFGVVPVERVEIEHRIANHAYGVFMQAIEGGYQMSKLKWLNRTLIESRHYYALCTSEKALKKELINEYQPSKEFEA